MNIQCKCGGPNDFVAHEYFNFTMGICNTCIEKLPKEQRSILKALSTTVFALSDSLEDARQQDFFDQEEEDTRPPWFGLGQDISDDPIEADEIRQAIGEWQQLHTFDYENQMYWEDGLVDGIDQNSFYEEYGRYCGTDD